MSAAGPHREARQEREAAPGCDRRWARGWQGGFLGGCAGSPDVPGHFIRVVVAFAFIIWAPPFPRMSAFYFRWVYFSLLIKIIALLKKNSTVEEGEALFLASYLKRLSFLLSIPFPSPSLHLDFLASRKTGNSLKHFIT